jgi:hypothetical protein
MSSDGNTSAEALVIPKRALRTIGLAILSVVALVLLIILGITAYRAVAGNGLPSSVDTSTYQAVFLTNGQVYFGSLHTDGSDYYQLTHVYLLQSGVASKGKTSPPTLIKLTTEIHSPQDELVVDRRQVLYIENLARGGRAYKIVQAGK